MTNEKTIASVRFEMTGQGAPLVLVPGGLTGWISWIPHAELLSANHLVIRSQLLAVDLGLENKPLPENYSVDTEVSALGHALDSVAEGMADFVAWSYGALVALSYAVRNPERVRSLTLIEPPAIWVLRTRGPLSGEVLDQQEKSRMLGPGDVSEDQLTWFTHFAGLVPDNIDPRRLPMWPSWMEHRQSLRTGDAVYRHQEDIDLVRRFEKPVLLFKGEGSSAFLHVIIDILAEQFPHATVVSLPGGHALQLISMDAFMTVLNGFLVEAGART
ncbi:MAG: alpha/beta fold hydrolase [Candidatus Geothermincolia bacterium]